MPLSGASATVIWGFSNGYLEVQQRLSSAHDAGFTLSHPSFAYAKVLHLCLPQRSLASPAVTYRQLTAVSRELFYRLWRLAAIEGEAHPCRMTSKGKGLSPPLWPPDIGGLRGGALAQVGGEASRSGITKREEVNSKDLFSPDGTSFFEEKSPFIWTFQE